MNRLNLVNIVLIGAAFVFLWLRHYAELALWQHAVVGGACVVALFFGYQARLSFYQDSMREVISRISSIWTVSAMLLVVASGLAGAALLPIIGMLILGVCSMIFCLVNPGLKHEKYACRGLAFFGFWVAFASVEGLLEFFGVSCDALMPLNFILGCIGMGAPIVGLGVTMWKDSH